VIGRGFEGMVERRRERLQGRADEAVAEWRGARVFTASDATSDVSFAWTNSFNKTPRDYYDLNTAGMAELRALVDELGGGDWHRWRAVSRGTPTHRSEARDERRRDREAEGLGGRWRPGTTILQCKSRRADYHDAH